MKRSNETWFLLKLFRAAWIFTRNRITETLRRWNLRMTWGQDSSRKTTGVSLWWPHYSVRLIWQVLLGQHWSRFSVGPENLQLCLALQDWMVAILFKKHVGLACHDWYQQWALEISDLAIGIDLACSLSLLTPSQLKTKQNYNLLYLLFFIFQVQTGTYDFATFNGHERLALGSSNQMPVPLFLWKLVYDAKQNRAIVFVSVNHYVQFQKSGTSEMLQSLCPQDSYSLCESHRWNFPDRKKIKKGILYCCTYQSLSEKIPWIKQYDTNPNVLINMPSI